MGEKSKPVPRDPAMVSFMAAPSSQADQRTGLHILIVEDNADTAESLALYLECIGHEAEVARDGPTALRAVVASRPDVVLLDISLPGMNGYEVARRIRGQSEARPPLLVAITGHGQEADRLRSAEAGIHIHLLKPTEPALLARVLQEYQASLAG